MFRFIPKPTLGPSFKSLLEEYKTQYMREMNKIPDRICLIWLGEDVPNTRERPYQDFLIKHKKLNPSVPVEIIVSKELLKKSGRWDAVFQKFFFHGIVVRDLDEDCSHYLNYDIMKKLMQNPRDYVWVSDILRMAMMYEEGGYYYDTDIEPIHPLSEALKYPRYGFYQYFPRDKNEEAAKFCFHAGVKGHFVYLLASTVLRHIYLAVEKETQSNDAEPEWLRTPFLAVRQRVACYLSGNPFFVLRFSSSLQLSNLGPFLNYPLDAVAKVSFHGTWLDQHKNPKTHEEEMTIQIQLACFNVWYEATITKLTEDLIYSKVKEYFPGRELKSLFVPQPKLEEKQELHPPSQNRELAPKKAPNTYFKSLENILEKQQQTWKKEYGNNVSRFWSSAELNSEVIQEIEQLEHDTPEKLAIYAAKT